ncbi:phage terminase small subunit P27 family [Spirosoma panaciterrae]|uniref:phage terminase small subunit P27 family n=1 Tax=Spirosoma panaciterrae TaxID=496058 RepID=UPI00035E2749|nr:phage terminase small subunit P27 family [Spirosoma panaciterrae]
MAKGRRPKPTEVKLLQGTLERSRINPNEPKPLLEVPLAPDWLPDEVKDIFNEMALHFADMRVLSKTDGRALELLADAYFEYREARQFIIANGSTYESITKDGGKIVRAYPQVNIASDAFKRVRAMLIEFGATPAARSRVEAIPDTKKDNALQRLMARRTDR